MNIAYKKKRNVKFKRKPRQEYALLKTGKRGRPKRLEIYQRIKGKVRHTVRPHIRKLLLKDHTKVVLPKKRIWNPATEQLKEIYSLPEKWKIEKSIYPLNDKRP